MPYKKIKSAAAARRAQLTTAKGGPGEGEDATGDGANTGKRPSNQQKLLLNGNGSFAITDSLRPEGKDDNGDNGDDVEMEG